jgi:TfoX/Sxy family transcriptional regulator of competence genes
MPAVDQDLRDRVREHLTGTRGIAEKAMFGGAGFTLDGKLLCGIMGESLLVRLPKEGYDKFIAEGAEPMVMAGKSSTSYLLVPKSMVSRKPSMKKWIDRAIRFVESLPTRTK